MTNFSDWVRRKLLDDQETEHQTRKFFAECSRCGTTWSSYNSKRVPHVCGSCLNDGHDPQVKRWTELEGDV